MVRVTSGGGGGGDDDPRDRQRERRQQQAEADTTDREGGGRTKTPGSVETAKFEEKLRTLRENGSQDIVRPVDGQRTAQGASGQSNTPNPAAGQKDIGDSIVPDSIEGRVESAGEFLRQGGADAASFTTMPVREASGFAVEKLGGNEETAEDAFDSVVRGAGMSASIPADAVGAGIEVVETTGAIGSEALEGDVEGTAKTADTVIDQAPVLAGLTIEGAKRKPLETLGGVTVGAGLSGGAAVASRTSLFSRSTSTPDASTGSSSLLSKPSTPDIDIPSFSRSRRSDSGGKSSGRGETRPDGDTETSTAQELDQPDINQPSTEQTRQSPTDTESSGAVGDINELIDDITEGNDFVNDESAQLELTGGRRSSDGDSNVDADGGSSQSEIDFGDDAGVPDTEPVIEKVDRRTTPFEDIEPNRQVDPDVRTVSDGPGGDFASSRSIEEPVKTADPGRNPGQGPTPSQTGGFRSSGGGNREFSGLSGIETQKAVVLKQQTADIDLRDATTINRQTPDADLREAAGGTESVGSSTGSAAGTAGVLGDQLDRLETAQSSSLDQDGLLDGSAEDTTAATTESSTAAGALGADATVDTAGDLFEKNSAVGDRTDGIIGPGDFAGDRGRGGTDTDTGQGSDVFDRTDTRTGTSGRLDQPAPIGTGLPGRGDGGDIDIGFPGSGSGTTTTTDGGGTGGGSRGGNRPPRIPDIDPDSEDDDKLFGRVESEEEVFGTGIQDPADVLRDL